MGTFLFRVLCAELLLYGKTTAISKSRYYAWKICKIWWKVIAGRIWWWDEFEWQKCVPSVINNVGHTPKNATMKNFTSTDFLGPIRFANKIRELYLLEEGKLELYKMSSLSKILESWKWLNRCVYIRMLTLHFSIYESIKDSWYKICFIA